MNDRIDVELQTPLFNKPEHEQAIAFPFKQNKKKNEVNILYL